MTLRIPTGRESGSKRGHGHGNVGYPGKEFEESEEFEEFKEFKEWKVRICPIELVRPLELSRLASILDPAFSNSLFRSARPGNQTQFMILDQVRMRRDHAQVETIAAAIGRSYIAGEAEPAGGLFFLESR
jgi:hypothetical protein